LIDGDRDQLSEGLDRSGLIALDDLSRVGDAALV
jgi:hypothetical protein